MIKAVKHSHLHTGISSIRVNLQPSSSSAEVSPGDPDPSTRFMKLELMHEDISAKLLHRLLRFLAGYQMVNFWAAPPGKGF